MSVIRYHAELLVMCESSLTYWPKPPLEGPRSETAGNALQPESITPGANGNSITKSATDNGLRGASHISHSEAGSSSKSTRRFKLQSPKKTSAEQNPDQETVTTADLLHALSQHVDHSAMMWSAHQPFQLHR
jgi:hypothetical protein